LEEVTYENVCVGGDSPAPAGGEKEKEKGKEKEKEKEHKSKLGGLFKGVRLLLFFLFLSPSFRREC